MASRRGGHSSPASGPAPGGPGAPGEPALRVLVVDDHAFYRAGLRGMLEDEGLAVEEAAGGPAALELAVRATPDVVLMDLRMPGMSGVEATRRLAEAHPGVPVLIMTASTDDGDVVAAVRAGARGYLLKDAAVDEVVGAIRAAARGEAWVSPGATGTLLRVVRDTAARSPEEEPIALSDREHEILRLIAAGKDNAAIGRELYLSPGTVRKHVSGILAKLEVSNRVEAAVYAVRRGMA